MGVTTVTGSCFRKQEIGACCCGGFECTICMEVPTAWLVVKEVEVDDDDGAADEGSGGLWITVLGSGDVREDDVETEEAAGKVPTMRTVEVAAPVPTW